MINTETHYTISLQRHFSNLSQTTLVIGHANSLNMVFAFQFLALRLS